ncbi:MAG: nitrogenase component 1, partial [Paeniclostridium sp.]
MYSLDVLNKLDEINDDKDIKSLSHAIFPGTHCPLFGVALTASYIKNMPLVVVGTSECTYYTKNFAYHRQKGKDSVYSISLKEKDVVFGAQKKVEKAIKQIIEIENPDAIMIVTTCVPELIGEDYSSIEYSLSEEVDIPIFVVNTEHFKCNSHIPGMTRALKSLGSAMSKSEVQD